LSPNGSNKVDNARGELLISTLMNADLYSIRLRAEGAAGHLCGAERIAPAAELPALAAVLVARAMTHAGGAAETAHCTIERLTGCPLSCPLPAVSTWEVPDQDIGRAAARVLLLRAGVADVAVAAALRWLAAGPAPGGAVMRGAMLIDAATGSRLEADPAKGVRVSRMDLAPDAREEILAALAAAGLGHHRVAEALVLAGKVLQAPGVVAELCWSDDPAYLSGYVAAPTSGYQRITRLKAAGDPLGGRALFVDSRNWDRDAGVAFLERQPLLFDRLGPLSPPQVWSN
jgi:6-carboxyhexanoate--CoA ligase